jgi:hypothetical protein
MYTAEMLNAEGKPKMSPVKFTPQEVARQRVAALMLAS